MGDPSSANRLIGIAFFFITILVFAFAFFSMTGGFRNIGLPGASVEFDESFLEEGPARPLGARPKPPRKAPKIRTPREPFIPTTGREKAYWAAREKAERLSERSSRKRRGLEALQSFHDTPLGRDLSATFELARRGRYSEAKNYLERLLPLLTDKPIRVQRWALKAAINVYLRDMDRAGLKEILLRYLEVTREAIRREEASEREKDTARDTLEELREFESELLAMGEG